jgi:phosphopentomutase
VLVHGQKLAQPTGFERTIAFQDVAATVATHLGVVAQGKGRNFYELENISKN